MRHDGLVFDLQRPPESLKISLLAVVMFVADRRSDDAGRGGGKERLDEADAGVLLIDRVEDRTKVRALTSNESRAGVAHLADRLRRQEIADRVVRGELPLQ